MKIFLLFINLIWAKTSICSERTCKICDHLLHGDRPNHKDRVEVFCRTIFGIQNCCTPFLQSSNLLGPARQAQVIHIVEEDSHKNCWIIPIMVGVGFGVTLFVIAVVSWAIRGPGKRIWAKSAAQWGVMKHMLSRCRFGSDSSG